MGETALALIAPALQPPHQTAWVCERSSHAFKNTSIFAPSLVPRPFEEEKGPGTHCVCMLFFPSKSWEFVFLSAYLSVNVNLDPRYMPKNHFCWQRFGLKMPAMTNLAITGE